MESVRSVNLKIRCVKSINPEIETGVRTGFWDKGRQGRNRGEKGGEYKE